MHTDALLAAPVLLALVLLVSGIAKLRAGAADEDAFVSLRLPAWLRAVHAPAVLPWAEIALAVALLVTGGVWQLVVAAAALVLFVLYAAIIARALGFAEPVTCSCFGKLGLGAVDRFTLGRNLVLVAVAVAAVLDAVRHGSVLGRLRDAGGTGWGWVLALLVAAALGALVAHRSTAEQVAPAPPSTADDEGYLRRPLPFGILTRTPPPETGATAPLDPDDIVHLRDLVSLRGDGLHPVLLVFLSLGCGPCLRVMDDLPAWARDNSYVTTIAVPAFVSADFPTPDLGEHVRWLHDPDRTVAAAFGAGYPTAVLVGADGVTAGGPVSGGEEVLAFLQDVHDELVDSGVDPRTGDFDPSVLETAG